MTRNVNIKSRDTEYTRSYSNIPGIELGGGTATGGRLSYAKNLYRDYDGDGSELIESIPGYRRIASFDDKIHGIYSQRVSAGEDCIIIHAGAQLYRMKTSERDLQGSAVPIAAIKNARATVFPLGNALCFIDNEEIIKIEPDGGIRRVGGSGGTYIPTLYVNREVTEDRNLLTECARERFLIENHKPYSYGTAPLTYKILDNELRTCAVSGVDWYYTGPLYIPSEAEINGERYSVIEILGYALNMSTNITELYVAEGVEVIGSFAFNGCHALTKAVLPRTLKELGAAAFQNCTALVEVYLGQGIDLIGQSVFLNCTALENIYYAGTRDVFLGVEGADALGMSPTCKTEIKTVRMRLPLLSDVKSVTGVTENGISKEFSCEVDDGGKISAVIYESEAAKDKTLDVIISLELMPLATGFGTDGRHGGEVLFGCTVSEVFDGRIFLSGNPSLPNTVFHSHRIESILDEGLYFPEHGYITAGVGGYTVGAMLAVGDSLAVFKRGDDGSGSIFYFTDAETDDSVVPRAYKRTYVHSGIGAVGGALSFMDDPVFITRGGLYALTQKAINYDRSVVCRSHNVNYSLLNEDLSEATLTEWCGYLVLGVCGRIYLADSRKTFTHKTGATEYEWFLLDDIGAYKNSTRVYRYDSYSVDDCLAHKMEGEVASGDVTSYARENGDTVYYVSEDGKKYTVYPTGELTGGDFSPATSFLGVDKLLFFGTESGVLLLFNNDKRGTPPDYIRDAPDFDPEEYQRRYARSIHPDFYGFDNHAATYAMKTAYDDCDIPHLTKSTVKHSLVIKCRTYSRGELTVEVGRGEAGYREIAAFPDSELSFSEINFESLSLNTAPYHTLPVAEKEKGWVEKQIAIYSSRYLSPIGIYSITYRFTVKGRIKRT